MLILSAGYRSVRLACDVQKQEASERDFYDQVWRKTLTEGPSLVFDCPYQHKEGRPELIQMLPKPSSHFSVQYALDVGCGNGRNSIMLAQLGYDVTGIDISMKAIRLAKQNANARSLGSRIRFVSCSAFRVPKSFGEFDLVIDDGVFHHLRLSVINLYVAKMARLTKPGGVLLIVAFAKTSRRPEHPEISAPLENAHLSQFFSVVTVRSFFRRYFQPSGKLKIVGTDGRRFNVIRFVRRSTAVKEQP